MAESTIEFADFSNGVIDRTDVYNPTWEGTGIFDELMKAVNGNIAVQYESGRLTGAAYADVYLGSMQTAITESMKFVLQQGIVERQQEQLDVKIAIDEVQLAENSEKWYLQKKVLDNQVEMSNIDLAYKEKNTLKDLDIKDKQIESADADIEFNVSKRTIMEQTRNDNIRAKAAEQFAEFMKYISAANVVPGATDFQNMRDLITAMNEGIANPDSIATINSGGTDYVKP